jgi:capsular exopolysaccharide synthesis family protein
MVAPSDGLSAADRARTLKAYADLGDVDLKEALLTLWRRKWLIILTILVCAATTTGVVMSMTPRYTGSVKLLFEEQEINLLPGLINQKLPTEQIQVIGSRAVAQRVIDNLGLKADPEFNPDLQPEPLLTQWRQKLRSMISSRLDFARLSTPAVGDDLEMLTASDIDKTSVGSEEATDDLADRLFNEFILDGFLDRLTVDTVPNSTVIEISFDSDRPAMAARIADAVADSYLQQRLEAKFEEIQRTTGWLDQRIAELREQVSVAEDAVEAYRSQTGLLETDGGTVAAQQVSELNSQLILARTDRAEREARRDQVRRLLNLGGDGLASATEVLGSPLISSLVEQEVMLRRKVADLSQVYGARHPLLLSAQAELEDLQSKIRSETARIAESMQAEVNVARERERLLEEGMRQLEVRVADSNQASVTLRALEREASAARTLLETFMQQSQVLKSQDDLGAYRADATIISYSAIPRNPSYPRKTLAVAAAIVVGGVIGVALALLLERFDAVFRSASQMEEELGIPVLSSVPDLGRTRAVRKRGLHAYLLDNPNTAVGEALRAINARMLLFRGDRGSAAFQFVSSEPEEGKSSLALGTAQMHAKAGRRVLLIDADFRQSSVATMLRLPTTPGLTELMARQKTVEEVVRLDPASGAHLITAGRMVPTAHDFLIGGRLAEIIADVRGQYDLIIVDSPPVLSVADAPIIAQAVDATIFVARWGKTRKQTMIFALRQLAQTGASIIGLVLSRVDVRRAASYTYGDAGQYHGKHKKYYLEKS